MQSTWAAWAYPPPGSQRRTDAIDHLFRPLHNAVRRLLPVALCARDDLACPAPAPASLCTNGTTLPINPHLDVVLR